MSKQQSFEAMDAPAFEKFITEDHDPVTVQKVFDDITDILISNEEILYIAVQKKPLPICTDSVVLTNRRFITYRPKMLGGIRFDDHIWGDFRDAQLKEGIMGATFTMSTLDGKNISVDYLPRTQARKLYSLTREMEENLKAERLLDGQSRSYPKALSTPSCNAAMPSISIAEKAKSKKKSGSASRKRRVKVKASQPAAITPDIPATTSKA